MSRHLKPLSIADLERKLRVLTFDLDNRIIDQFTFNQQAGKVRAELARRETINQA